MTTRCSLRGDSRAEAPRAFSRAGGGRPHMHQRSMTSGGTHALRLRWGRGPGLG